MSSELQGLKAKRVIQGSTIDGYDGYGNARYKDTLLVEVEANYERQNDTWLTVPDHGLFTHLIERINELEETNRLLCKALGIRRNRNVKRSSS
jgi:hypothetical protein